MSSGTGRGGCEKVREFVAERMEERAEATEARGSGKKAHLTGELERKAGRPCAQPRASGWRFLEDEAGKLAAAVRGTWAKKQGRLPLFRVIWLLGRSRTSSEEDWSWVGSCASARHVEQDKNKTPSWRGGDSASS